MQQVRILYVENVCIPSMGEWFSIEMFTTIQILMCMYNRMKLRSLQCIQGGESIRLRESTNRNADGV